MATHTGEAGVAEIFRTLQHRLRDSAWTIVFKALIVVHLMIREGQQDAALTFLADNPKKIAPSNFSEGAPRKFLSDWGNILMVYQAQSQGHNIRRYSEYLIARARAFEATKTDYVRSGLGRLKRLGVEKGLLRETEFVQKQIRALLRCDVREPWNLRQCDSLTDPVALDGRARKRDQFDCIPASHARSVDLVSGHE